MKILSSCTLGFLMVTIRSANATDLDPSPFSGIFAPSPSPTMRALDAMPLPLPVPTSVRRVLAATTTAKPKVCRRYLTTQCSDSHPVCIKDCRDRLVQVLALQEAQDAYIATRGLAQDALGIYVDYREQEQKLTLDSLPVATEWLFLSGLQLNGKLEYDFPEEDNKDESASLLTSVILAGENIASIEKVNFPDQVTTIKLVGTSLSNLVNARFPASLTMLDASSNQIESLSCCGFPDTLRELYLSYNALDRLENLVLPSQLETLAVNWNAIAIIRNVTFPATLSKFYFVENPISLVSLSQSQWSSFLKATEDFVTLEGEPSLETSCVTGYFGAGKKYPFLACLLGEEPAYIENADEVSGEANVTATSNLTRT